MRLTLLGTGAAAGWPNPFCRCASCAWARDSGEVRGQTSVLVNRSLQIDCGPEVPRNALRLGVDLTGVRHLLVTHSHADHAGPAALVWRAWAGRAESLDVVAPASVAAAWRPWVGPDDPVVFRTVGPGDVLRLRRYEIRALPAAHDDDAVLYDVTAPDGARLLYATDTGPLPEACLEAVAGRSYDVVLLEETFGSVPAPPGHLDLASFPLQIAELRRRGAIVPGTRVLAVHLGHHNPPTPELARHLDLWGAEVRPDGAVLDVRSGSTEPDARSARRVLLLGGARSGKSAEAERRMAAEPAVTYIATSADRGDDPEWAARVAAHRARRPPGWRTVETLDLERVLAAPPGGAPVLIDCLTLWLAGVLDDGDGSEVERRMDALVGAWRASPAYVVAVSNEVGWGIVPATASGRRFRDLLGVLNARLAAASDEVWLVTAGIPRRLR